MSIAERFEKVSDAVDYAPHAVFEGVFLKHLVTGEMTSGRISSNLVKVEPFCSLDEHTHEAQTEIHEVIQGAGECLVAGKRMAYLPGTVAVIPQNTPHSVTAGASGLYLLAKFSPSLL